MLTAMAGVLLIFFAALQVGEETAQPENTVHYWHPTAAGLVYEEGLAVEPLTTFKYHNVTRQAYDYTCGAAALTTILDYYLGRQFEEKQILDGLLRFGETQKIIERKAFSLLDMKRLTTALGHPSGGFKATFDDIKELDHPAIVQITYGGFEHFVVLRAYKDGHIYVADPALGNISFTEERFKDIWGGTDGAFRDSGSGILFIVFPNGFQPNDGLALRDADLRVVDEQTINHLAFNNAPYFSEFMNHEATRLSSLTNVVVSADEFDNFDEFEKFTARVGAVIIESQTVDAMGISQGSWRAVYSTPEQQFGKSQ